MHVRCSPYIRFVATLALRLASIPINLVLFWPGLRHAILPRSVCSSYPRASHIAQAANAPVTRAGKFPVHRWVSVTTFLCSPRGGEQATVEKGCEKVFLHHPRWLFGIPSTVLIIYANIHALLRTNISHYQGTFKGDYLVPWEKGISCIMQYSNII